MEEVAIKQTYSLLKNFSKSKKEESPVKTCLNPSYFKIDIPQFTQVKKPHINKISRNRKSMQNI